MSESTKEQVERLGKAIIELDIGEPSEDEGAVDCAIRLLQKAYQTNPVFKPGDVVRLKGHKVKMTVASCGKDSANVIWFTDNLYLAKDAFVYGILELVVDQPVFGKPGEVIKDHG